MLESSGESVLVGEKNERLGAGKHQTRMDTGVKGDAGRFRLFWT